jgi:hypothetical protein
MIQVLKEAQLAAQQHQLELLDLESSASLDWILQTKRSQSGMLAAHHRQRRQPRRCDPLT